MDCRERPNYAAASIAGASSATRRWAEVTTWSEGIEIAVDKSPFHHVSACAMACRGYRLAGGAAVLEKNWRNSVVPGSDWVAYPLGPLILPIHHPSAQG